MNWEEEPFIKVYVRDTAEFLGLSWQARCLFFELLRKVDRAGIIKVGNVGVRGIALALRAPVEEIEGPFAELVEQGRLVWKPEQGQYLVPNFVAAQNARQSGAARKRRERERTTSLFPPHGDSESPSGTTGTHDADGQSHAAVRRDRRSHPVTPGHAKSHAVTPSHTESCGDTDSAGDETSEAKTGPDSVVRGNESPMSRAVTPSHAESHAVPNVTIRSDQIRSDQRLTYVRSAPAERADREEGSTLAPIDPDAPLSAEARAYAQTLGITDVDAVYRDFVNYNVAEARFAANWDAMWRLWCGRALPIQRRERDRAWGRRSPMQMDEPGAVRGWTMPKIHYAKKDGEPQ